MSKQIPEVRPCPHCGSPARSVREYCDGTWAWVVVCDGCDAEGPMGTTEAMAVKRWNHREADKLADAVGNMADELAQVAVLLGMDVPAPQYNLKNAVVDILEMYVPKFHAYREKRGKR